MKKQLNSFSEKCAKLSYFLTKTSTSQEDLFLSDINRIIDEENLIVETQNSNSLNKRLFNGLKQLKTKYEECLDTIKSSRDDLNLPKIYDLIKSTDEMSMIKIQLNAIKKYQRIFLKNNEYQVHINKTCS